MASGTRGRCLDARMKLEEAGSVCKQTRGRERPALPRYSIAQWRAFLDRISANRASCLGLTGEDHFSRRLVVHADYF